MTITHEIPALVTDGPLSALWAEVTGMCQLSFFWIKEGAARSVEME